MNEGIDHRNSDLYRITRLSGVIHRRIGAIALLAAALGIGTVCRADFSFNATSGGVIPVGTGTNLILTGQPASQVLNFSQLINIQDVEISTTATPQNLINTAVPFSFTFNIVQTPGVQASTAGTGSVTASGSLLVTRADVGGELSNLVSLTIPTLTIGNTQYTFTNPTYAAPVVNSAPNSVGAGNFTVQINPTITPEPTALGLLGILGLGLRRNRKAV